MALCMDIGRSRMPPTWRFMLACSGAVSDSPGALGASPTGSLNGRIGRGLRSGPTHGARAVAAGTPERAGRPAPNRRTRLGPQAGTPARSPALHLRQQHPGWGAGLIRVMLQQQGIEPLPAERTLQRWFARAGLGPAPPGRRPEAASRRATRPHDTWQVDAAEEIRLADDTRVSWLRIADEFKVGSATGARAMEGRDPSIVWQIRHSVVHNVGVITQSDAIKLRLLTKQPVESPRHPRPDPGRFAVPEAIPRRDGGALNRRVGERLAELLTTIHATDPGLFDPDTVANEISLTFGIALTVAGVLAQCLPPCDRAHPSLIEWTEREGKLSRPHPV